MTGHNGNGKTGDEETQTKITPAERRRIRRLTNEEFNAYYDAFKERIYLEVGKKVVRGMGWLLVVWAVLAFAEYASKGKISLGTIVSFFF